MRLLLVEDDSRIARFVARGLQEQSYAVDVVSSGDEALYHVDINDYDVVILDVMIPGKDGFTTCRAIRGLGKRMPILMLTARDAVEDRIHGLDSGADDYLTKPFEFGELLARLRALLRRPKDVRPTQILVGDLELDTGSQTARRRNRSISLTAKEYALLEYL
ncbi:MAG: response regulator transcription factor, partial [Candidatus Acidiferrum sp.]